MIDDEIKWRPGSFTKNFGWGPPSDGLLRLHEMVRVGFDGKIENVPRELFRSRVSRLQRPDYIALQFFLYNAVERSEDLVIADELVFQAVNFEPGADFDKLALFAFLFSLVGRWRSADQHQRRPAEWARNYTINRVAKTFGWKTNQISADDIESYVSADPRYEAKSARKLSTNLNYLFVQGRLQEFDTPLTERWWVNSIFLALDRTLRERNIGGQDTNENRLYEYLVSSGFNQLSGPRSIQKDLAVKHLVKLYWACGGLTRFSDQQLRELAELRLPQLAAYVSNNPLPIGAVHKGNPNIQKTLPRVCAQVAKEIANFETMEIDELENFDIESFIKNSTRKTLEGLSQKGIRPTMTAEELLKFTRDK
jgi:hypothetical protein